MTGDPGTGFEEAFDELFRRAHQLARRILGDSILAEDVAAEALARAYARWPSIADLAWRDGWVLRVTTNLAIDATRRRGRSLPLIVSDAATDEGDAVAVRMALVAALQSLPKRQREAITLRYVAGLGEAETARALGISAGTVKTHLHRGVAALRAHLGPTFEEEELAVR